MIFIYAGVAIYFDYYYHPTNNITILSLEQEVWSSNLEPVNSGTMFPTAHRCCDITLEGAVLPERIDAEMAPQLATRFGVLQRV